MEMKRDRREEEPRVIVVGGGPAGLMAAGRAAQCGAGALLLEKMDRPGRKLGITGKGRCNLTNEEDIAGFIAHFGPEGRFLWQAFSRFFTSDLLEHFRELGVPTVTERGGRIFPASGRSADVVDAMVRWIRRYRVSLRTGSTVEEILVEDGRVAGVSTAPAGASPKKGSQPRENRGKGTSKQGGTGRILRADAVIVSTGGASYPGTGSTGDGYRLAESVGHRVTPIRPALVPLVTAGDVAPRLQGLSLRNVKLRVLVDGVETAAAFGEMLFTHFGLSGPIVLSLSGGTVDALAGGGKVALSIDLKPALEERKLDARLLRDIAAQGKKGYRGLLKGLLPGKLIPVCIEQTGISPVKPAHQIGTAERRRLLAWLKDLRFAVTGHRPLAEAIITRGGVDTREIDPRTMASRIVKGLYFAGEVLDLDADTGGYNLQAAFSTGWLAGLSAARQPR